MNRLIGSAGEIFCLRSAFVWLSLLLFSTSVNAVQYSDDLVEATLKGVVGLRASVPEDARTVISLGTTREGNGIVIDNDLVLTMGYLILEASDVEVTNSDGAYVPAEIVAYDEDSGFGLVKAKKPLGINSIPLGDSAALFPGEPMLVLSHIGPDFMEIVRIADVRDFPGYWEYLLEEAIFTVPDLSRLRLGGAALINNQGELVGVGFLTVPDAIRGVQPVPGDMFVPINRLKPILDDLIKIGRASGPPRPWLGIYLAEDRGHSFVYQVVAGGPAATAGLRRNDIIVAVNDNPVSGMAEFLREVWATGPAGVDVRITVIRQSQIIEFSIRSGDRYKWYKFNPVSKNKA